MRASGVLTGSREPRAVIAGIVVAMVLAGGMAVAAADPTAESSARKVNSRVKVTGIDATTVKGKVRSRVNKCEKGRFASLIRLADGANLGTDRTNKKGKFRIKNVPLTPGTGYFVGVGKKTITKFRSGKKPRKIVCGQRKSKPFAP